MSRRRGWTPLEKNPRPNYARMDRELQRENERWPKELKALPPDQWPAAPGFQTNGKLIGAWRSRDFMALGIEDRGFIRLAIHRASIGLDGKFRAGISWDDLQRLKREAGFGDRWMVEILPPDDDIVDVANNRQLWLLPEPPPYGWRIVTPEDRGAKP